MTETDLKDKLTLLFELLEDPFAADDVETVIEGVTLELYKKELKAFIKLLYRFWVLYSYFIHKWHVQCAYFFTYPWLEEEAVGPISAETDAMPNLLNKILVTIHYFWNFSFKLIANH